MRFPQPRSTSPFHSVVIEDRGDGDPIARQVNNLVTFGQRGDSIVSAVVTRTRTRSIALPAGITPEQFFDSPQISVVPNPVPVILFSSYGLLNGSEWTSNQPSEGIYVIAEWLARKQVTAAPLCIDPNLASWTEVEGILRHYRGRAGPTILGFSALPVNLENDARLICRVKDLLPDSKVIVGGIGSESLLLLPTRSGKRGIQHALPVDAVLTGSAVEELSELVGTTWQQANPDEDLSTLIPAQGPRQNNHELIKRLQESRENAHQLFIPQTYSDLIHSRSYGDANAESLGVSAQRTVPVLVDNRCTQGCYFCASPKNQVFMSIEEAADHVAGKASSADVLAFNDNDLSNDPEQTLRLCELMREKGVTQPKHGKMRVLGYNPQLIDALASAGFVRMTVGVESFSHLVRRRLGKARFEDEAISSSLQHMLDVGITPEINLILFSPHETMDTLRETSTEALKWAERGALLYCTFGVFATPNSPSRLWGARRMSGAP